MNYEKLERKIITLQSTTNNYFKCMDVINSLFYNLDITYEQYIKLTKIIISNYRC